MKVVEDPPWGEPAEDRQWWEQRRDPLADLVCRQDGVIARWQARQFLSDKAIRHRLATGRWRRLHRAVFHTYGGEVTLRQRHWAALLAATPRPSTGEGAARLGGVSALQVAGLRGIAAHRVDVVVAGSCLVKAPPGVVIHRVRSFVDGELHPFAIPPATAPSRSVVDAAAWARSDDEARLVVAASFQQRLVTLDGLQPVLRRLPSVKRRRLIVATADDAAGGSHSLGELSLVELCRAQGLPTPTRQHRRRDSRGRQRYLDAVFEEWRVAIEIDGSHHSELSQMWDDSARQNDLMLAGYVVLRYPVHVVRTQPERVGAEIRAALIAAGWREPLWL